jgi:hypothetical protein
MPTALLEALERLKMLAVDADPQEQEYVTQEIEALSERLKNDREWDELLATPESQAFLHELSAEVDEAIRKGETVEGGWSL